MDKQSLNISDQVGCRIIHLIIDIHLIPPASGTIDETDTASDLGNFLVKDILSRLKNMPELNGFILEADVRQTVY